MRILVLIVVVCFCPAAAALGAVELQVAEKGSYVYWFSFKDASGEEQVTLPQRFKGTGATLETKPLGEKFSDAKLHVMDKATGNTAILDFDPAALDGKPLKLSARDFQYVRAVRLRVVSEDGAPLESAVVRITDGLNTPMTALVTPADGGVAEFFDVAAGEINVKVEARGLKRTIDSDITLPEKRRTPVFEAEVRVSGDVDTLPVAPEAAAAAPESEAAVQEAEPERVGTPVILQTIAGLIFLLVVAAVILAVVKARGLSAEAALRKLGVQLPQDQAATSEGLPTQQTAPAVDPSICQFCGQKKDASGSCACTIVPPVTSTVRQVPRLVGVDGIYAGRVFEIGSASMCIGREETCDIALSEDSTVSRRHAVISCGHGECLIEDQGSSNGTFVNGVRVTGRKLVPGDEIQIGSTRFRFEA